MFPLRALQRGCNHRTFSSIDDLGSEACDGGRDLALWQAICIPHPWLALMAWQTATTS